MRLLTFCPPPYPVPAVATATKPRRTGTGCTVRSRHAALALLLLAGVYGCSSRQPADDDGALSASELDQCLTATASAAIRICKRYIQRNPNDARVQLAWERVYTAAYHQAKAQHTYNAYLDFARTYPRAHNLEHAAGELARLLQRDLDNALRMGTKRPLRWVSQQYQQIAQTIDVNNGEFEQVKRVAGEVERAIWHMDAQLSAMDPTAADYVRRLQSSDHGTAAQAAIELRRIRDYDFAVLPYLIDLLDNNTQLAPSKVDRHGRVLETYVQARTSASYEAGLTLGAIGEPAVGPLVQALHFGADYVRIRALQVLSQFRLPHVIPHIVRAVLDENDRIHEAAVEVLRKKNASVAARLLRAELRPGNPYSAAQREHGRRALDRLEQSIYYR